jgi:DNA mismatch endonuclease (patch repair protein)
MVDVVDRETRSRMMAGIQGKHTRPEVFVRRGLHAMGYRYRLHVRGLPGRPDLVFPSRRCVIFVNGCFWHGHSCPLFKWPSTRRDWWRAKITATRRRDRLARRRLQQEGWRVLTIWECALKGSRRQDPDKLLAEAALWLDGDCPLHEIGGAGGRAGLRKKK